MRKLGLTLDKFDELEASLEGRAELRRRFVDCLNSNASAEDLLMSVIGEEEAATAMNSAAGSLCIAAVLAGACKTALNAHTLLWEKGFKACCSIAGFEIAWIAALEESGGWPTVPQGLEDIHRWLAGPAVEKMRAIRWLSGLRWDSSASRVAEAVYRGHKHKLSAGDHRAFTSLAVPYLEKRAEELIASTDAKDTPPHFVGHALRATLLSQSHQVNRASWIVRHRENPTFSLLAIRTLQTLRNHPAFLTALLTLVRAGIPGIEQEVERTLLKRAHELHYTSDDLVIGLIKRSPKRAIDVLSQRPAILSYLHSESFFNVVSVLPIGERNRLMDLFRQTECYHALSRMGDKTVVPALKQAERSCRKKGEFHRFRSLGPLVFLSERDDQEVQEALLVRIREEPIGWPPNDAARLLAAQGDPHFLWERINSGKQGDQHGIETLDVFALTLGAAACGDLRGPILHYLTEMAMGDRSDINSSGQSAWKNKREAAVIGLHALQPANIVEIMRELLLSCPSSLVRLLAAESLEKMGKLADEVAILPIWRQRCSDEFRIILPSDLALHDLHALRRLVCGMAAIRLDVMYADLIEKDLDMDGTRHLFEPERQRTLQIRQRAQLLTVQ